MDPKLTLLKLVMDALGTSDSIAKLEDRKRVQKTIYLAQVCGLDLGYRYGWYLLGPYCPELTRDYFAVEEDRELVQAEAAKKELVGEAARKLARAKPLLSAPSESLSQEDWLELLASYHYLRKQSGLDPSAAKMKLSTSNKVRLLPHLDDAVKRLKEASLLAE